MAKTSRRVTWSNALLLTTCVSSLTGFAPPTDQHMIALISILIPVYECYRLGVWPSLAPERDHGRPKDVIQMAPSHVLGRERTYSSAIALRDWFRDYNLAIHSFNVLTEDCHARIPTMTQKTGGVNSDGVREVIGASIAYIYARFLFYPSASPRDKKMAQASRASR